MDNVLHPKRFYTNWKKNRKTKKQGAQSSGQQEEGDGESGSSEEQGGASQPTGGDGEAGVIVAPEEPAWEKVQFESTPEQPYQAKVPQDVPADQINLQIVPNDANVGRAQTEKERKEDPSILRALFDKVTNKTKAPSLPDAVTLSVDKEGLFATTESYGCTVIVVFNGTDFLLGNYARRSKV